MSLFKLLCSQLSFWNRKQIPDVWFDDIPNDIKNGYIGEYLNINDIEQIRGTSYNHVNIGTERICDIIPEYLMDTQYIINEMILLEEYNDDMGNIIYDFMMINNITEYDISYIHSTYSLIEILSHEIHRYIKVFQFINNEITTLQFIVNDIRDIKRFKDETKQYINEAVSELDRIKRKYINGCHKHYQKYSLSYMLNNEFNPILSENITDILLRNPVDFNWRFLLNNEVIKLNESDIHYYIQWQRVTLYVKLQVFSIMGLRNREIAYGININLLYKYFPYNEADYQPPIQFRNPFIDPTY